MYIEPAHAWDQWRNQEVSTLNFSWNFREFNEKMIRIKIDFNDPLALSPFPRYDKLMIYVPDLKRLFNNYDRSSDERRRLEHTDYQALFTKGV